MCFNMLTPVEFKVELRRFIRHSAIFPPRFLLWLPEQVGQILTGEQGAAQDSHDLVDVPAKLKTLLYYRYETVGDDCGIYLDSHRILVLAPERLDPQVLLYPFEEQLHSPSVFVKEGYLARTQIYIVGVVHESPFEFRDVDCDTPYGAGVILKVPLSGETHILVKQHVPHLHHVRSVYDFILRPCLLPYYEERVHEVDFEQTGQVPIPPVEYIARPWLVLDEVHGIHVIDLSLGDVNECGYLSDYVNLGVELDATLGTSEVSPFEYAEAEVNGGGVESVELPANLELLVNPRVLRHSYHMRGEILEDVAASNHACLGEHTPADMLPPKPQMIRLIRMGCGQVSKLPEAGAALNLSVYHHQEMIPIGELPPLCVIGMLLHNLVEFIFRQEVGNLREKVSSLVHNLGVLMMPPSYQIQM